jgi:hypothetical protein
MTNPFDDILSFYRNMEMEERVDRDNSRDRLARIVYAKPDISGEQKQFFSQLLPLLGDRILDGFSSHMLQESFEKLLDDVVGRVHE